MSILSTTKSLFKKKVAPAAAAPADEKKEVKAVEKPAVTLELLPLMTEKGIRAQTRAQTAIFHVPLTASKRDIARAVEIQYKVKPLSIRTTRVRGKIRRRAQSEGMTSNWKKAYVKVEDVQKLQVTP